MFISKKLTAEEIAYGKMTYEEKLEYYKELLKKHSTSTLYNREQKQFFERELQVFCSSDVDTYISGMRERMDYAPRGCEVTNIGLSHKIRNIKK